jgi:hypothetical protein
MSAANLAIIYLKRSAGSEKAHQVRYYVDEVIDFFAPSGNSPLEKAPAQWNMLKTFRARLEELPVSHPSLDDLANEALASATTPSGQNHGVVEQPNDLLIANSTTINLEGVQQTLTDQQNADQVAGHGECSNNFTKISNDFFSTIEPHN